ncbi:MAG: DUF881 domain-containing protein [Janthinobacterium lividum]
MDMKPQPIEAEPKQDRRTWWMTLFLLCAILGAMLALSVRTQQVVVNRIAGTSSDILQKQVNDLQRTIKAQQDTLTKYEAGASSHTAEAQALSADLKSAKFLAGLTAVQGPGVEVTLNDSKTPFPGGLPAGMAPPNIIHDTDINQVVNELKAAGAEAVSVNDQRLVAVTPIRCAGPTIFVNNTAQTPPYLIKAIGEPKTLETALNISGGIASQIKQFDKAMFNVVPAKHISISAYSGVIQPKYALPVPAPSDKKSGA